MGKIGMLCVGRSDKSWLPYLDMPDTELHSWPGFTYLNNLQQAVLTGHDQREVCSVWETGMDQQD